MKYITVFVSLLLCQVKGFINIVEQTSRSGNGSFIHDPIYHQLRSTKWSFYENRKARGVSLQLQNDSDTSHDKVNTSSSGNFDQGIISWRQKAGVCLYRLALTSASIAYTVGELTNLLSGSGLSANTISTIQQNSHTILTWGIFSTALLVPTYLGADETNSDYDAKNSLVLLLNKSLPGLASIVTVLEIIVNSNPNIPTSGNIPSTMAEGIHGTTDLLICALCLREIGFFGVAYKAEAILTILFFVALEFHFLPDYALKGGISICLLVLSFGKLFEPLDDDVRPNGSAFFRDDR